MTECWILSPDHEPIPVDTLTWARWFEIGHNRRVAFEQIGPYEVSTVFLGLDHNFLRFLPGHENDPPVLFETMAFRPMSDAERREQVETEKRLDLPHLGSVREAMICDRCSTWDEAVAMHQRTAEKVRQLAAS